MGLIAACVVVFLADRFLSRPAPGTDGVPIQLGALYGPAVAAGQWWRLIGTVFEHGNWLHLALNMSVVFTLGFPLERALGTARMAVLSWVSALGSSTFALLFAFYATTVGASGMILGWAGALLPVATREARRNLITWLVQVAVISLLPGVSWQGHLGGFLFGLPCGYALRLSRQRFLALAPLLMAAAAGIAIGAARFAASR
jgi:membrane associated rhomboid family serine protease